MPNLGRLNRRNIIEASSKKNPLPKRGGKGAKEEKMEGCLWVVVAQAAPGSKSETDGLCPILS